jgi:hypothetical protein
VGPRAKHEDDEWEMPRPNLQKTKAPAFPPGLSDPKILGVSYASFRFPAACLPRSLTTSKLTF